MKRGLIFLLGLILLLQSSGVHANQGQMKISLSHALTGGLWDYLSHALEASSINGTSSSSFQMLGGQIIRNNSEVVLGRQIENSGRPKFKRAIHLNMKIWDRHYFI